MMSKKPSRAETEILQLLWAKQPRSVKDIHEELSRTKSVGYTTTLKQVQRMFEKGFVTREKGVGKSYDYSAAAQEEATKDGLLDRFVKTAFDNSVPDLVMHALGNDRATPEDIAKIRAFLDSLESGNGEET